MSDEKTAEAKLIEAEARLTEQQTKLDELQRKLDAIPNNPEHFNQLKTERDEAKKKLKELEEAEATKRGEFEKLSQERAERIKLLEAEKEKVEAEAGNWTNYAKATQEKLIAKITDDKRKTIAKALPIETDKDLLLLQDFVELETTASTGAGSSNHKAEPSTKKPIIEYKNMN